MTGPSPLPPSIPGRMSMPRRAPALLLGLLLPAAAAAQPGPRLDPHGDPLPAGALQRLGKVERLRQGGGVTAVALSPDGKVLASANAQGAICLWDTATGKERGTLPGHQGAVPALAFSPDGSTLASGGADRAIHFWDASTGKHLFRCYTLAGAPLGLAFSGDGKLLASGGDYRIRSVRLWDLRTGLETDQYFFAEEAVTAVALSPDGKRLASADRRGRLTLWDATTGKPLQDLSPAEAVN